MKAGLLRYLVPLLALACLGLVGSIELLNVQAHDAIGRKQQQEPHSKWRISSEKVMRVMAERDFRDKRAIPMDQKLTSDERMEVDRISHQQWAKAIPHHRLAHAMRTYSVWGIPLGILTALLGFLVYTSGATKRTSYMVCCAMGVLTLAITAVRYFPSLGW